MHSAESVRRTKNRDGLWRILLLVLGLATALGLSLESWLSLQGRSLCRTTACEVVGHYVRIGEPLLVAGGALFFWIFFLGCFLAGRYPRYLVFLPPGLLFAALSFDGAIIGFQLFTIGQKCILCLTVASLLFCAATLLSLGYRRIFLLFFVIAWLGGFLGSSVLSIPEPRDAYSKMAVLEKAAVTQQAEKTIHTLVFSLHCPHCREVVEQLARKDVSGTVWRLAVVDEDAESLNGLAGIFPALSSSSNPFQVLARLEQDLVAGRESGEGGGDIRRLRIAAAKARTFIANLNLSSVPVLLVETKAEKRVFRGAEAILHYLDTLP